MSLGPHPLVRDWLRVEAGRLMLRTGKVDIGQRISTALVRIAMEELALPFGRIGVAPVRTGESPDEGITSGSNSIEYSGHAQRRACATARELILKRAAEAWHVPQDALVLEEGGVSHRGTNRRFDVIDLLADLPADLVVNTAAPPRDLDVPLEDTAPRGLAKMVAGQFTYVHDLERPGMLHARIIRPPVLNATLQDVAEEALERLAEAGLTVVREGAFFAVAGEAEWPVVRAAQSLGNACRWKIDTALETGDIHEIMQGRPATRLAVIDGTPMPDAPVPDALNAPDFEARFDRPYTLHGALAPSAALAEFADGKLHILTHSQGIYSLRGSIADSLGMVPEDVMLEHVPGSGCYGHNAADDAAFEAALVARAMPGTPVLLKYSREDEHGREPVGTAMSVQLQARRDAEGHISALWMEARGDTHRGRPRAGPNRAGAARLAANAARNTDIPRFVPEPNPNRHAGLHRNLDPIYSFPEKRMVKALVPDLPLRPSALRCLGAPANILAIESAMDELALDASIDPIAFRIAHLDDPRAIAVLKRLHSQLERPITGDGAGRGIAYAQYKNAMTRVAIAVDLRVDDLGAAHLDTVRLVADAGRVVDPDGLRAQLEGGVLQGASWALFEEVRWGPEGRESLDWESYPVLRFEDVPRIEITLIDPGDVPSVGAGEASPSPTVAAIANAIHDATGLRLRRMPFTADAILQAALQE